MEKEKNIFPESLNLQAQRNILTLDEAVKYLNVSKSFLYKMTSNRKISFTKPNGGKLYFHKSALDNWMLQNEFKSIQDLKQEIDEHIRKR